MSAEDGGVLFAVPFFLPALDSKEFLIFWKGWWEWARLIGSYDTLGQTPHFYQPGLAANWLQTQTFPWTAAP